MIIKIELLTAPLTHNVAGQLEVLFTLPKDAVIEPVVWVRGVAVHRDFAFTKLVLCKYGGTYIWVDASTENGFTRNEMRYKHDGKLIPFAVISW